MQARGVGGADTGAPLAVRVDEVLHRGVGEQPAPPEDDEVVGERGGLVHEVAGDEDRAALAGEAAHQFADPDDAFGVQSVGRFVEHHDLRVAEECGCDAEALAHAQRERLDPAPGDGRDPGELHDLVDPPHRDAVGGGKDAEVIAGGT